VSIEKLFASRLRRKGWHSYTDEDSQRVVTNAYPGELEKVTKVAGMPCEIVSSVGEPAVLIRIGPKLSGEKK